MSARSEAAKLIKSGCSPTDVAKQLGKTERLEELRRLLLTQVGEGKLLLSEIYFSIPEARRKQFQSFYEGFGESLVDAFDETFGDGDAKVDVGWLLLRGAELGWPRNPKMKEICDDRSWIDCDLYWLSKDSPYTDTYRFLRDLEMTLHRLIRKTLQLAFQSHDDDWLYKGLPPTILKRCLGTKVDDGTQRLEPYAYTNFIDFKEIIARNWGKFREVLPLDVANDKNQLLDRLQKANEIRNGVMHPIKQISLSQDDCKFVRKLRGQLLGFRWRKPIGAA